MIKGFSGGVHPPEKKGLTEEEPIRDLDPPEEIILPIRQHIGSPAEAIVEEGDEVKKGQKVAESSAFVSAPVHSPVSGTVKKIESHVHPSAGSAKSIFIENDGEETLTDELEEYESYEELDPSDIQDIVREAGIVGMGGAAFPTTVKLSPPDDKNVETVIINGAECEPYLTADHRLILEHPEEIIEGTKIIMKTLDPEKCIFAIEDNKEDAYQKVSEVASNEDDIEVTMLKTKYPQGAEKQLVKALTGKEVPSGGLPFDVGCYVQNVGTAKAIRDAILDGKPLIERIVTVTGEIINTPLNLRVRVGTKIGDLLEACDGAEEDIGKVIMGGPMMGVAQPSLDMPVLKATSGALFFSKEQGSLPEERPCISCARCVDACPSNLMPVKIAKYSRHEDFDKAEQFNAMDCIECGSCSYVCPTKRKLVHYIKWAKNEIQRKRRKASSGE